MTRIHANIQGVPYARRKSKGNIKAPKLWTERVVKETRRLPKVSDACLLRITYRLPRRIIPTDYKYGTDLDNLNKRFLDALSKTVFSDAPGRDSCVVAMEVMKIIVDTDGDAGATLEILPIQVA